MANLCPDKHRWSKFSLLKNNIEAWISKDRAIKRRSRVWITRCSLRKETLLRTFRESEFKISLYRMASCSKDRKVATNTNQLKCLAQVFLAILIIKWRPKVILTWDLSCLRAISTQSIHGSNSQSVWKAGHKVMLTKWIVIWCQMSVAEAEGGREKLKT